MTQICSFILFRKREIDCTCAIPVIILSSLNQPYWIPQAVAVPEAGAGRKIDGKRMIGRVRKRMGQAMGNEDREESNMKTVVDKERYRYKTKSRMSVWTRVRHAEMMGNQTGGCEHRR